MYWSRVSLQTSLKLSLSKNLFLGTIFPSPLFSLIGPKFSSVAQSCPTCCNPMDCSTPGLPVHHQLLELVQTHVYRVSDTIQPSHPLSSPSPPAFNLSLHQGLFQWVSSSHQVAKVLELQLQHQSFQWIFRTDFLQDWLAGSPCSPRDSQDSSPKAFAKLQGHLWASCFPHFSESFLKKKETQKAN